MIAPSPPSTPAFYPEQTAKLLLAALLSSTLPQSTNSITECSEDGPPELPMTITVDATTRIMGHCNTIQLSSAEKIAGLMTVAMKGTGVSGSERKIEVKVAAGVEVRGSKNVVIAIGTRGQTGGNEGSNGVGGEGERSEIGRKRRAESEPLEMPSRKRVAEYGAKT